MNFDHKKVLVLAPHTDDGELGCGGTMAKLLEEKCELYYAVFSACEQSVPEGLPKNTLELELKHAVMKLGLSEKNLFCYKYPVRRFNEFRQDILEGMIRLKKKIEPDIVIMPGLNDIHQDHYILAKEGIRAFKQCSLFGYEMVWNNLNVNTRAFVKLEQRHLDMKIESLQEYKSQWGIRNYFNREFIESMAIVRGIQVNAKYAEAFDVIRCIL